MLDLSNTTLVCVEPINPIMGTKVIQYCQKSILFGDTKFFSTQRSNNINGDFIEIPRLTWNQYNDFILHLNKYINTDFCLVVQTDGFPINTSLWTDNFLNYDFVGSPWPYQQSWRDLQNPKIKSYYHNDNRVGNGGFSLRSKKFLEWSDKFVTAEETGEDQYLCVYKYQDAINNGMKFAPPELAIKFSVENPVKEMGIDDWRDIQNPLFHTGGAFGFHGKNLPNFNELVSLLDTV